MAIYACSEFRFPSWDFSLQPQRPLAKEGKFSIQETYQAQSIVCFLQLHSSQLPCANGQRPLWLRGLKEAHAACLLKGKEGSFCKTGRTPLSDSPVGNNCVLALLLSLLFRCFDLTNVEMNLIREMEWRKKFIPKRCLQIF